MDLRENRDDSPSSMEGKINPRDPTAGTNKDDCDCLNSKKHKQWWLEEMGKPKKRDLYLRTRSKMLVLLVY